VPLNISSRGTVILLNYQQITGFYEKNFNKEFPFENFLNNRTHGPYYILKVLAQTDGFFLKYGVYQKWTIFGAQ